MERKPQGGSATLSASTSNDASSSQVSLAGNRASLRGVDFAVGEVELAPGDQPGDAHQRRDDPAKREGQSNVQRKEPRAIRREARERNERPSNRQPTETMNFEEGETIAVATYLLSGGGRPYDLLQNYCNAVAEILDVMGTNHLTGIANFIDTMQFEGSQRAQADILSAIFKSVGEGLLGSAVSRLVGLAPIPGLSTIVGLLRSAIEAATNEVARAGRAGAEANLAAWSREIRSSQAALYSTARVSFRQTAEASLPLAFDSLEGTYEGNLVTGDKATMLRNLEQHRTALRTSIPSPQTFQDATAAQWVTNSNAGGAGTSASEGVRHLPNGRLRVWVDTNEQDGVWTFRVDRATLHAASHRAQAADLIREALGSGRKTLWNCGIPVQVMLHAPNVMPGGRTWYQCAVSGPQRANGPGPYLPEADRVWRLLLRDGAVWTEMEQVAHSRLEGGE